MAALTLNAGVIAGLPIPETGQKLYYDDKVRGFAVRVTKTARTYICESRVKGKTRRVKLAAVGTLTVSEARKRAQQELGKMAGGIDVNAAKAEERAKSITLSEALEAYLSARKLKPSTRQDYVARLRFAFPDWFGRELKSITPSAVVQRFDKLTKEHGQNCANGSFRPFRAIYRFARALTATDAGVYVLPECPCQRLSDLKRWHPAPRRTNYLRDEQLPAFFRALDKAHSPAFADFAELLIRTGLRRNEAATLLWQDVNLSARAFTITPERAKNGQALTLPMSLQTFALFQRRAAATEGAEAVFATSKRFDPRKSLVSLRCAMNDPKLTLHDLRRTAAIQAERIGTPYSYLKKMLNHSPGGDVTMTHYLVSDDPELLRPFAQSVSDQIDRLSGRFGPYKNPLERSNPIP